MMMMKAFGFLLSFSLLGSTAHVVNFDTFPIGKLPPGWSVTMTNRGGAPVWKILRDQTAPTQPYVLAQTSDDPTGNRSPLAIYDAMKLQDGDVSVRIKPVAGHPDPGGGLVWRYRDENNYYLVRTNSTQKAVSVFKVENGRTIPLLPPARHEIPLNGWSILKVSMRGNRFQIYVDHRRLLQGEDPTFSGWGKVGLWTGGNAVTYFDDFRVSPR